MLVSGKRVRVVECPWVVLPDVEEPVFVDIGNRRGMRGCEHRKRLVEEGSYADALVERDGGIVGREEHGRRVGGVGCEIENPEVAEAVMRDRKSRREHLLSPDR